MAEVVINKLVITISTKESQQFIQDIIAHGPSGTAELMKVLGSVFADKAGFEFQINSNSSVPHRKLKA